MAVNLKGMSRKELEKLRSDIDKAIEKIEVEDKKAAMAAAEKAASEAFKLQARIRTDAVSVVAELPENAELIVNDKDV